MYSYSLLTVHADMCQFRFHFPQVLVVMNAGIVIILSKLFNHVIYLLPNNYRIHCFIDSLMFSITLSVIIGRQNIICSRKFLFDAIDDPTVFCTVQG